MRQFNFRPHPLLIAAACLLPAAGAQARTVTLSMDVKLDQVAPEDQRMYRIGGHDIDRVTYDDSAVDPRTHRVRVSSLSHYIGGRWFAVEPADASILDMSSKPYRLNFASSVNHGRPLVVLFEADTQRMAMLARPDFHVLIGGRYSIDPRPLTDDEVAAPPPNARDPDIMPMLSGIPKDSPPQPPPPARIVALDVDIVIDKVSPEEKDIHPGQHHNARVFFDQAAVDPATHRVAVLHEQHTPMLIPRHLDPAQMPMSNAWLDFSTTRIGYHFAAAPTVGFPFPYFVLFDETTHRMTIRKQVDGTILLAGAYTVNPRQITGPDIDAAVSDSDPGVPPWVTRLSLPAMPEGGKH